LGKKKSEKKTSGSSYFAHLKRTSKELPIYKQVFDYVILLRTMVILPKFGSLIFANYGYEIKETS
jgi:hypothetical protein